MPWASISRGRLRLVGVDLHQPVEEVAALIEGGDADAFVEAVDAAEVGLALKSYPAEELETP